MFWKKETNSFNLLEAIFTILFRSREEPEAEMFEFKSRERRKWFRIRPSEKNPAVLRLDERKCRVHDIGAAGLSFTSDGFTVGESRSAELELPEIDPPIRITLKVLSIDSRNICHCSFRSIEENAVERIHQYVLRRQKEIVRENKQKSDKKKKKAVRD